jgi:sigma-B regulation protein RsbU (phosphoserine phosphatase)
MMFCRRKGACDAMNLDTLLKKYANLAVANPLDSMREAVHALIGEHAVAAVLETRTGAGRFDVVGFMGPSGGVIVPLRVPLEAGSGNAPSLTVEDFEVGRWLPGRAVRAAGPDAMVREFDAASRIALLRWYISTRTTAYLVLLDRNAGGPLDTVPEAQALALNVIATEFLRRTESRQLADANAWIDRELREIAALQNLLRPDNVSHIKGVDIAVCAQPFKYAGGDYYEIARLSTLFPAAEAPADSDAFAIIIADVSGHGAAAAVEAAMLDAILRTYAGSTTRGLAYLVGYLNRYMFTRKPRPAFATAFVSYYDPRDRGLRHVCAGHPPPILRRRGSPACEDLEVADGIPLLVLRDYQWAMAETRMEPGDILVLYTDGVTECRSPQDVQFGRARLREAINAAEPTAAGVMTRIRDHLNAHAQGLAIEDDQTILVVAFQ